MFSYFQAVDSNGPDHLRKRFFSRTMIVVVCPAVVAVIKDS